MPMPEPIDTDIDTLFAPRAARQTEEPSPRPPHTPLVWQTLVESDVAVTRAAVNAEGDVFVQCLSAIKKYRAMIHIPRDAFPALRALLGEGATVPPAHCPECAYPLAETAGCTSGGCPLRALLGEG